MTRLSLLERRYQQATKDRSRLQEQREATIERLLRIVTRLKKMQQSFDRYERKLAKFKKELVNDAIQTAAKAPPPAPPAAVVNELLGEGLYLGDGIPDFLDRTKLADAVAAGRQKDELARQAILAEQAGRKKAKAGGRIAAKKAKQAGDTNAMPLTGKAALAKINQR